MTRNGIYYLDSFLNFGNLKSKLKKISKEEMEGIEVCGTEVFFKQIDELIDFLVLEASRDAKNNPPKKTSRKLFFLSLKNFETAIKKYTEKHEEESFNQV